MVRKSDVLIFGVKTETNWMKGRVRDWPTGDESKVPLCGRQNVSGPLEGPKILVKVLDNMAGIICLPDGDRVNFSSNGGREIWPLRSPSLQAPTALLVAQRSDASAAFKVQSVKKGEKSVCHYFTRFSAGSQFCQRLHNNPLCHREISMQNKETDK